MAAKTFNIEIDGYLRDVYKKSIPDHSGIYFVYECTHNKEKKTVKLNKLIYIGGADNVNERIADHEKYNDWLKHVKPGNTLCYSTGPVKAADRPRVEAAYIFQHQPPENDQHKTSFNFDETTVNSTGKTVLLSTSFTLNRSIIL